MIQISRTGTLFLGADDDLERLQTFFACHQFIQITGMMEPSLLCMLETRAEAASRLLHHLLNSPALFRIIERITRCGSIGSCSGVIRRVHENGYSDSWPTNPEEHRLLACCLNLSKGAPPALVVQIRQRGSGKIIRELPYIGYGEVVLSRIGDDLEHKIAATGGPSAFHFCGWFLSRPSLREVSRQRWRRQLLPSQVDRRTVLCGTARRQLNVILVPMGTTGDVHPFLGLGRALRSRGHKVSFLTHKGFEPLARLVGLDYIPFGNEEDFRLPLKLRLRNRGGWPRFELGRTLVQFARHALPLVRRLYTVLERQFVPGSTVVVGSSSAFGARLAQEKIGVPLVTVHLQPLQLRSSCLVPVLQGMRIPDWAPRWWKKLMFWLRDVLLLDPTLSPEVNAFRAELGLPPVRRLLDRWRHSPQRVIGLFPEWYAPPQPDWPSQVRLTGFPMFDESEFRAPDTELSDFLGDGGAPLVFSQGTALQLGKWFFEAAVRTCRKLRRRGILLTRFRDQLPVHLPEFVRHVEYVPLSRLLPRCSALVHPGGIGAAAQAMAAGIPQIIIPVCNDQFDNAARLERLGVARTLAVEHFKAPNIAQELKHLLGSSQVVGCCKVVAQRIREDNPLEKTCQIIEELL